ncbi:MAG: agglutinin biogenesis protein MshP [Burkholderiaceae bacterium]
MQCTSTTCPEARRGDPQRGFTLVSAVFILVVLAALGAALAKLSVRQQLGSAAEVQAARAQQSARAGLEWASFQVLRVAPPPAAPPACFGATSFTAAGLGGFTVTVNCARTPPSGTLSDGVTTLAFYELVANACNAPSSGACPASGTAPATYVERQLTWTLVR